MLVLVKSGSSRLREDCGCDFFVGAGGAVRRGGECTVVVVVVVEAVAEAAAGEETSVACFDRDFAVGGCGSLGRAALSWLW